MTAHAVLVAIEIWIAIAVVTAIVLLRLPAPYGRHARPGWGPTIPARVAWMMMELPSPLVLGGWFLFGGRTGDPLASIALALWVGHYAYRAIAFPLLASPRAAPVPVSIVASAIAFNVVNGSLNGLWLFVVGPVRGAGWLTDPRFVAGTALFIAGFVVHLRADAVLRALRRTQPDRYQVPRGGIYESVSCPNYFGEIVEWLGFALLTWSPAGLSFAIWTAANLVPRALAHHRWYRETFPDYPATRRAIVPGVL